MGGLAGHMSHLYEDPDLTFKEIKDVFVKASNGELIGTEKTDGQNLMISYSVKNGEARAVRNKGEIKQGGLSPEGLAQKFKGRGDLTKAFVESFTTFEKAVRSLEPEVQMMIFGSDADIYYNSEIQDPRTRNVVAYDHKTLNIHNVGHVYYDKETGEIKSADVSKNAKTLDKALETMQQSIQDEEYNIQKGAVRNLQALSDDTAMKIAVQRLEREISSAGISDNQTILDYLKARIEPFIDNQIQLDKEQKKMLFSRIFNLKDEKGEKVGLRDLYKVVPKEQKGLIKDIVGESKFLLQKAIEPVEVIIHEFSVEMLKGLQSAFILDNVAEVVRLRQALEREIQQIEASGQEEAIEVMQRHMKKLGSVENISTAAEGFVFDYDGHTYKFTGNFAPVNQIMGLLKYDRTKIGEGGEVEDSNIDYDLRCNQTITLLPGAYKPPHKEHLGMAKHYSKVTNHVYIIISPGARGDNKTQAVVTPEKSRQIWDIYLEDAGLANVSIEEMPSELNSPVEASIEWMVTNAGTIAGDCVVLGASTKPDKQGKPDYERYDRGYIEDYIKGEGVHNVEILDPGQPGLVHRATVDMSGTKFREALMQKDYEVLKEYIPEESLHRIDEILSILNVSSDLSETKKKGDISSILYGLIEEVLNEQTEPFQIKVRKKHPKMKNRLIGKGGNKHYGGGKGHSRPSMKRGKSAPPLGEDSIDSKEELVEGEYFVGNYWTEREMEEISDFIITEFSKLAIGGKPTHTIFSDIITLKTNIPEFINNAPKNTKDLDLKYKVVEWWAETLTPWLEKMGKLESYEDKLKQITLQDILDFGNILHDAYISSGIGSGLGPDLMPEHKEKIKKKIEEMSSKIRKEASNPNAIGFVAGEKNDWQACCDDPNCRELKNPDCGELEEVATMSGGAVEVSAAGRKKKKKKHTEPSLIRREQLINDIINYLLENGS
tara:strand:- start:3012 stop:5840 length:2829 start_codon:yes stop_codon:yes gene_type:complete